MIRIIISGANGAMGRVILSSVSGRSDFTAVAGIDVNSGIVDGIHIFSQPKDCNVDADVIIDFSHPMALDPLLSHAVQRKLPIVIATTGISNAQIEAIKEYSKTIPIFFSFNMSLGVNLMLELAKISARVLGDDFDIEIIERHHSKKIDSPSGTALMIADSVSSALRSSPRYTYDRHSQRKARRKDEIGIHSVRGGTIVGDHDIIFAGKDEILTISHSAHSKQVFATGAINAAAFLVGKEPGLYSMKDLI